MEHNSHFHNCLLLFFTGVVLLLGCAGPKVVEVDYDDWKEPGPRYTPREKPAEWVWDEHAANFHGAENIGRILIQASDRDNVKNAAPVEAAKFGADFYNVAHSSSPVTGKGLKIDRYSYTRGFKTDYGGRKRITETTIRSVDRYGKGWWCELYRVNPDPKERDRILRWGFYTCVRDCKGILDISSACSPFTLKGYLAKGMDPNVDRGIPLLYSFINCIVTTEDFYEQEYKDNYEKLRMLLDAGADPNLLIKGGISENLKKVCPVLKNYREPCSVLKIVRDAIMVRTNDLAKLEQEPRKKRMYNSGKIHLDFLKRIQALLVERGARIH